MGKYSIGVNFGINSGTAILADVATGEKLSLVTKSYNRGAKDSDGVVLQHPMDYLELLQEAIPELIANAGIDKDDIAGLGISFDKLSVLPVMKDGTPLCFFQEYAENDSALVRIAAKASAKLQTIEGVANERDEAFLSRFGGKLEKTGLLALILELLDEDAKVYETADMFMDAADWIIWQLTGTLLQSSYSACIGAMWDSKEGYPDSEFLSALNPALSNLFTDKLVANYASIGTKAASVSPFVAEALGLSENTSVAVANIAEQTILPALALCSAGQLVLDIDKTTEYYLLSETDAYVPSVNASIKGALCPELTGYIATRKGPFTKLDWINSITKTEGIAEDAAKLKAGESGLLALWGGNSKLSGLFVGLTDQTTPAEMYRSLVEAWAFDIKNLVDCFVGEDIPVNEIYATGEYAINNPGIMQLLANVLGMPVKVKVADCSKALGSAILGAYSAGDDTLASVAKAMGVAFETVYTPCEKENAVYTKLYHEYTRLFDYFGHGANSCMSRLGKLKASVATDEAEENPTEDAVAELFDTIEEAVECASTDEDITEEEISVPDLEIPQEAFDELLDTISEESDDIEIEEITDTDEEASEEDTDEAVSEENNDNTDEFPAEEDNDNTDEVPAEEDNDELADSLDATAADEATEEESAGELEAAVFAGLLDDQLEADDIDFDALDDLAKLDGVAEDGDVVSESEGLEISPEVTELMEKYDATFSYVSSDVEELMDKYDSIDASVPGEFEKEDIIDELEEFAENYEEKLGLEVASEDATNEATETTEDVVEEAATEVAVEAAEEVVEEASAEDVVEAAEDVVEEASAEDVVEAAEEAVEAAEEVVETAEEADEATIEEVIDEAYTLPASEEFVELTDTAEEFDVSDDSIYQDAADEVTSEVTDFVELTDATDALEEATDATEEIAEPAAEEATEEVAEIADATDAEEAAEEATEMTEEAEDATDAELSEDEEVIPVPTLSSEFPEFSATKVRTNTSIPDDFWRY